MEHVTSADGTEIAYRATGEGEPVLLVHGAIASSADWAFAAPRLRGAFRAISMDRRGRGRSGDAGEYAMEREAEDIAAVLEATGARAVVAHSYGALCTLLALERGAPIERLVLYEPPLSLPPGAAERIDELEGHLAAGAVDAAAAAFLASAGASEAELELIRASPAWPYLCDAAPTLPRELRSCLTWETPAGPFDIPTLLLIGADTDSPVYLDGVAGVERAFPALERDELAGQRHIAHVMAADAFAARVAAFLALATARAPVGKPAAG
jgi:pimeloyl-ACP methyl ester carboxylesterase